MKINKLMIDNCRSVGSTCELCHQVPNKPNQHSLHLVGNKNKLNAHQPQSELLFLVPLYVTTLILDQCYVSQGCPVSGDISSSLGAWGLFSDQLDMCAMPLAAEQQ